MTPSFQNPLSAVIPEGRALQAGVHPKQGRLATARVAEQDQELAIRRREIDVVDGAVVTELLGYAANLNFGHAAFLPCTVSSGTVSAAGGAPGDDEDRKSTRLNSSH